MPPFQQTAARLRDLLSPLRYTLVVSLAAAVAVVALTDTWPVTDQVFAPMALALAAGMLLTVRLTAYQTGGAMVLLPAMAVHARFGLAALPLVLYVAVAVNLLRGMRGPRVLSTAAHLVLSFAAADVAALFIAPIPAWLTFAVVFVTARVALWHV